jgi:hypothetical protein
LLPLRLGFHEAHLRPLRRDHDRLSVGRIVFLPLHKRPDILWRNQFHLMAELHYLSRPVVRAAAGFHHHDRR